ncbi:helix-turn-helix transcriptional regulator [Leifsonia sp. NPDC058292]|uniref:helix-turn-helix transcriptional regulator n=1 Tax=Leifsonia sp. NPDC058292 TaxID=3346428 RepID=UPI0036D8EA82
MSAAYLRRHRVTVPAQLHSYTPEETAAAAGLTLDELRRMRENGQGPAYVTIGKRTVRYIRSDADEWKAAHRSKMSIHS